MDHSLLYWGLFGGVLGNLLRLVKIANMAPQDRPIVFKDPWFYVQFVILAGLGVAFVFLYLVSKVQLNPVLATNVGAAAPLIAQCFLGAAPPLGRSSD